MCLGGGGAARRAAEEQAKEAARQAEIERKRIEEEAKKAKEEQEKRHQEELARLEARYQQQQRDNEAFRQQIADQEALRLSEQRRIEEQRKAERDADLARADKERADNAAAAAAKAAALTEYNAGRQSLVDSARQQIEGAFAGFNDDYFNKYGQEYVDYYKPQLQQQYDDAKRQNTFAFANRGNLNSSAAARAFSRIDQTNATESANLAQRGVSAANDLRGSIDKQKADALNAVFGAINAAPVVTADNVGDANSSLAALSSALTSPVQLASSSANSVSAPAFGTLSNVFQLPTQQSAPRTSYGSSGANSYSNSRSSSGRLVA